MKYIKFHYGLLITSFLLFISIIITEVIKSSMRENDSWDLAFMVEYGLPAILIMILCCMYYSSFRWNMKMRSNAGKDLFWISLVLGLAILFFGLFFIIEEWEKIFPGKPEPNLFSDILGGLLNTKPREVKSIEKVIFYLHFGYSAVLFLLLSVMIFVRTRLKFNSETA